MEEKLNESEVHKEIDLIQSCINRMAKNSFMIKGWMITLYAVILTLLSEKENGILACAVLIVITLSFWYLDAFYLRTEKTYRKVYDWILDERSKNNRELLYQLNPQKFKGKIEEVESISKVMWSNTLKGFYLIPLIFVVIVLLVKLQPYICRICCKLCN